MKKLLEYLPFHFTLFLIIGITSQFNFRIWSYGVFAIAGLALVLFITLVLFRKSRFYYLVVWLFFFFTGIATTYLQDDRNYDSYYGNHIQKETTLVLAISKVLKSNKYYNRFEASVVKVDTVHVHGKLLLNTYKDSIGNIPDVGDILVLKSKLIPVSSPLNPHQFNYRSYLEKQGIYHQVFAKNNEFLIIEKSNFSLYKVASKIRNTIQLSLQRYIHNEDVLSIVSALLLGQRQDISKELVEDYSKAGAIHILAVSGLHVGILLLIFSYLLRPFERIKRGKIYKTFIVVLLLWMFALITGLSASVVRAVTMFTFVSFGMLGNRRGSVLYALMSSAFFLLLFKPMFLFDVGFQLSYLAVFGIVWLQPMLYSMWKPRYWVINKLWQLCTVSVAAQTMILPLSLFYFHQFPGLFMFSNLVIVPFLGMILIGGILCIVLSLIGILPDFLVRIYETGIETMNGFVHWIAVKEEFLITDIPFSLVLMVASYLIIFSLGNLCGKWNLRKVILVLGSVIMLQGVLIYEKCERYSKSGLIIFHKNRETIIGKRLQNSLDIYSNVNERLLHQSSLLKSYALGENVSLTFQRRLPYYFSLHESELLIVDDKEIYEFSGYKNPIVLLRQSPKINVQRLIDHLKPRLIIADGSNYKSVVIVWRETCLQKKTPFWYTGQNGAYILEE